MKLSGDYKVTEMGIKDGDWLDGKKLKTCRLPDEGVTVLGVYRDDDAYVGVPDKVRSVRHYYLGGEEEK